MKERPMTRAHWTEFMVLLLNRKHRPQWEPRSIRTGLIKGTQLHTYSPNSHCTPDHWIHTAHLITEFTLHTCSPNSHCTPDQSSHCTPDHRIHIAHLIELPLYTSSLNSHCIPDHWVHTAHLITEFTQVQSSESKREKNLTSIVGLLASYT